MRKMMFALAAIAAFTGRASAITPKDLSPDELVKYEKVKTNPKAVESFLATRDYVHKAAAVIAAPSDKKLALAFKRPKTYDDRYLLEGDADTINSAIDLSLGALADTLFA
jgi:hypothetical protein